MSGLLSVTCVPQRTGIANAGPRDYHRPWKGAPPIESTYVPTTTDLGSRVHPEPPKEPVYPPARSVKWTTGYQRAHTLLWGGGGNWQRSVDEWEAKEKVSAVLSVSDGCWYSTV